MPPSADRSPFPGSERRPVPGTSPAGRANSNETANVTVILRPSPSNKPQPPAERMGAFRPNQRTYLTRAQFAASGGASPDEIAKVQKFASEHGLKVVEASPARRSVVLSGTVAQLNEAFGVDLMYYGRRAMLGWKEKYRGHAGPVNLPNELIPMVRAVLGLDNRPQARQHNRPSGKNDPVYPPPQVASLYDFPKGVDGSGQTVAIVELGGGYALSDLQTYFSGLGIPVPSVTSVSVDGGTNSPTGDPSGPDAEVMLDVEVIGSIAPRAQIVVYFAPNTDQGFADAVSTAVHDGQHNPSVISISWGSPEDSWSSQGLQALNSAIEEAASMGVTVCAASGDQGSSDGLTDNLAHVDFPASSPYALGCGGTKILASNGAITSEVAWDDLPSGGATGGGVSDVFPLPTWQSKAGVPPSANPGGKAGRGVPDVCGDAAPSTGYLVRADGSNFGLGGTSAVAPLWAGLIALLNQKLGKPMGFANPLLYYLPAGSGAFHDITQGNNGAYTARSGWDPCTGLGSPDGAKLGSAIA